MIDTNHNPVCIVRDRQTLLYRDDARHGGWGHEETAYVHPHDQLGRGTVGMHQLELGHSTNDRDMSGVRHGDKAQNARN